LARAEGKLSGGNAATNGTAGQQAQFTQATLLISTNWSRYWYAARDRIPSEGTVGKWAAVTIANVADGPSGRNNRMRTRRRKLSGTQTACAAETSGNKQRVPQNHPECKHRTLPELEGLLE
jgi:hypothetical protein